MTRDIWGGWLSSLREALHLPVFELDRGEPAKNGNGNPELPAGRVDLVDAPVEIGERAVVDLDLLAHCVLDLRHFLAAGGLDPGADLVDVRLSKRGERGATDKADDPRPPP